MSWSLLWGDQAEWLEGLAEETGTVPQALASRVVPYPWVEDVVSAFSTLSPLRRTHDGGAPLALGIRDIAAYCELYGVLDPERMVALLRACDTAFLGWAHRRRTKPGTDTTTKNQGGP